MVKILFIAMLCMLSATLSKGEFNKEEAIKKFMTKAEDCRVEVGAAASDIEEIVKKEPASTREGKCLRACLMKKYKVLDDNGKFAKDVAFEHAKMYTNGDEAKLKIAAEIGDACAGISVPDDHCDAAVEYLKCFKEQAKAHGIEKFEF